MDKEKLEKILDEILEVSETVPLNPITYKVKGLIRKAKEELNGPDKSFPRKFS